MHPLKLVFCGHVRQRIDRPRVLWRFAAPAVVDIEVVDETGFSMRVELPAARCHGVGVGSYVRLKHRIAAQTFGNKDSGWFAFRAPTPKPVAVGRGRVISIASGRVCVLLENGRKAEFEPCNVRGALREGDTTTLMAHRHGHLEQYCSRYLEEASNMVVVAC